MFFKKKKEERFAVDFKIEEVNPGLLFGNANVFDEYMKTFRNHIVELVMAKKYENADAIADVYKAFLYHKAEYDRHLAEDNLLSKKEFDENMKRREQAGIVSEGDSFADTLKKATDWKNMGTQKEETDTTSQNE